MYSCFLKRVIDFIIAFCVLAAIFPILHLLIIFLHFANKGAGVFFTQNRPGKNAKIFADKAQKKLHLWRDFLNKL